MKTSDPTFDVRLRLVQVWSGLVLSLFLAVHLVNQAVAVLGADAYDTFQRSARSAYQAPVVELLLVLVPLLVHAVAGGLAVWRGHRRRRPTPIGWVRWHRYAGRFLFFVFVGHVGATRGASFFFEVWPGFDGLAFTFVWMPASFWPYYLVLGMGGALHTLVGLALALPAVTSTGRGARLPLAVSHLVRGWLRRPAFVVVVVATMAMVGAGVFGLGGVLVNVDKDHARHSDYARLLYRLGLADPPPVSLIRVRGDP